MFWSRFGAFKLLAIFIKKHNDMTYENPWTDWYPQMLLLNTKLKQKQTCEKDCIFQSLSSRHVNQHGAPGIKIAVFF